MAILVHGKVSVLVFSSPDQRASIGKLLVETDNPHCTRIAVSDDEERPDELRAALEASRKVYPLPPGLSDICELTSSAGSFLSLEHAEKIAETCCVCRESLEGCYVVVCEHGYNMHEDPCGDEDELEVECECPVGRLAGVTADRNALRDELAEARAELSRVLADRKS